MFKFINMYRWFARGKKKVMIRDWPCCLAGYGLGQLLPPVLALIQFNCAETLAYTPGASIWAQPYPQLTTPTSV